MERIFGLLSRVFVVWGELDEDRRFFIKKPRKNKNGEC